MNLKKRLLPIAIVSFLSFTPFSTHAAIPVIDDSNIMQQAKTLAETIKVVTNTAQQITLQLQELQAWPKEQLDRLQGMMDDGLKRLETIANQGNTGIIKYTPVGINGQKVEDASVTVGDGKVKKFLDTLFPILGGEINPITTSNALQAARDAGWIKLSQSNVESITKIQGLLGEAAKVANDISELNKLSEKAVGAKQSAQIANHIAAAKGRLESINTIFEAVKGQHQILKDQQELQDKINQQKVVQSQIAADEEATQRIIKESEAVTWGEDPWKEFVNKRGYITIK